MRFSDHDQSTLPVNSASLVDGEAVCNPSVVLGKTELKKKKNLHFFYSVLEKYPKVIILNLNEFKDTDSADAI